MGKEKIILTGDRPTGKLHIGHYVGSLKRRVELQNSGSFDKTFIFIADAQALTDNIDNPEKVRQNVIEVALDYLACGLDPEKSTIFINPAYVAKAEEAYGITAEQIATLTPLHSLANFIPVTLGNMLGGMIFVGLPLYLIYKKNWENK